MLKAMHRFLPILSSAGRRLEALCGLGQGSEDLSVSHCREDIEMSFRRLGTRLTQQGSEVSPATEIDYESSDRVMAVIATQAWRIANRVVDPASGDPREELGSRDCRGIVRSVQTMTDALNDFGIVIKDRVGEIYDEGLPEKVIQGEEREELTAPKIIETLKPTVFRQKKIIQLGDIIVGVPLKSKTS
jgi:hypothetical protein